MVGLVVRDHDRREPLDPKLAKPVLHPISRRSGVHEHRVAVGRIQQDRVALADVEHADAQMRLR